MRTNRDWGFFHSARRKWTAPMSEILPWDFSPLVHIMPVNNTCGRHGTKHQNFSVSQGTHKSFELDGQIRAPWRTTPPSRLFGGRRQVSGHSHRIGDAEKEIHVTIVVVRDRNQRVGILSGNLDHGIKNGNARRWRIGYIYLVDISRVSCRREGAARISRIHLRNTVRSAQRYARTVGRRPNNMLHGDVGGVRSSWRARTNSRNPKVSTMQKRPNTDTLIEARHSLFRSSPRLGIDVNAQTESRSVQDVSLVPRSTAQAAVERGSNRS